LDGPAPQLVERVNHALRGVRHVWVRAYGARFVAGGVRADSLGVHWSSVADSSKLDPQFASGSLDWDNVVALEIKVRRGPGSARAGAIQLGTAAAVGVGVAAAAEGADINSLGAAFFGGILGAGVGAVVGGVVGTPLPHWRRIYP
jgi:hypothetical protein